MQDGLTLWAQRVKKTRERLTALRASSHPHARRTAGQERKLAHQEERRGFYQQHVEAGTFPPVVFGTKKRWLDRFKTLDDPIAEQARQQAWREEWDESRNGRLSRPPYAALCSWMSSPAVISVIRHPTACNP